MTMSTDVIRNGRRLRATPLPVKFLDGDAKEKNRLNNKLRLAPEWVLLPGTKISIAPHGCPEPRQVLHAVEVASQISAFVITSESRVREVVEWRHAACVVMRQMFPKFGYPRMGKLFHRDHTSVLHAVQKHEGRPSVLAAKIEAIKAVLA